MAPAFLVLAAAMTAHVPAEMGDLSRAETARITGPELTIVEHDGVEVRRAPGDVLVIFKEHVPAEWRGLESHRGAVAAADLERRIVFVFTRDLERATGLDRGDPRYRLALGRVVAHELEHLRRGRPGHDDAGWFRACPSPRELTELGWGPRSAEGRR